MAAAVPRDDLVKLTGDEQRPTLPGGLSSLQDAGLIEYRRGHIRLLDLDWLRRSACECYATIKAHAGRLLTA